MLEKGSKRVDYLDQLKGFGIILVVVGHFIEPYRNVSMINSAFICIYSFHMPLFCLLSGIVAQFDIKKICYKKLWVYILAQFIFLLFGIMANTQPVRGVKWVLRQLILPYWHMWYLFALIIWLMTLPFIKIFKESIPRSILVIGYTGFALSSGYVRIPFALTRVIAFYVFFLIGNLYKDELLQWIRQEKRKSCYAACILTLAVFLSMIAIAAKNINAEALWEYQSYYDGNYTFWERVIFYISAMVICVCWCCVSGLCKNTFLIRLGKRSLPVYIFHAVFVQMLDAFHVGANLGGSVFNISIRMVIAVIVVVFLQSDLVVNNTNRIWNVWIKKK